jgi:hypothetical protein
MNTEKLHSFVPQTFLAIYASAGLAQDSAVLMQELYMHREAV